MMRRTLSLCKWRKPHANVLFRHIEGFIRLELPVFHVGYVKHLVGILQCVCKSCARVMVLDDERRHFLRRLRNPRTEVRHAIERYVNLALILSNHIQR